MVASASAPLVGSTVDTLFDEEVDLVDELLYDE
jgi:hypothetical protein